MNPKTKSRNSGSGFNNLPKWMVRPDIADKSSKGLDDNTPNELPLGLQGDSDTQEKNLIPNMKLLKLKFASLEEMDLIKKHFGAVAIDNVVNFCESTKKKKVVKFRNYMYVLTFLTPEHANVAHSKRLEIDQKSYELLPFYAQNTTSVSLPLQKIVNIPQQSKSVAEEVRQYYGATCIEQKMDRFNKATFIHVLRFSSYENIEKAFEMKPYKLRNGSSLLLQPNLIKDFPKVKVQPTRRMVRFADSTQSRKLVSSTFGAVNICPIEWTKMPNKLTSFILVFETESLAHAADLKSVEVDDTVVFTSPSYQRSFPNSVPHPFKRKVIYNKQCPLNSTDTMDFFEAYDCFKVQHLHTTNALDLVFGSIEKAKAADLKSFECAGHVIFAEAMYVSPTIMQKFISTRTKVFPKLWDKENQISSVSEEGNKKRKIVEVEKEEKEVDKGETNIIEEIEEVTEKVNEGKFNKTKEDKMEKWKRILQKQMKTENTKENVDNEGKKSPKKTNRKVEKIETFEGENEKKSKKKSKKKEHSIIEDIFNEEEVEENEELTQTNEEQTKRKRKRKEKGKKEFPKLEDIFKEEKEVEVKQEIIDENETSDQNTRKKTKNKLPKTEDIYNVKEEIKQENEEQSCNDKGTKKKRKRKNNKQNCSTIQDIFNEDSDEQIDDEGKSTKKTIDEKTQSTLNYCNEMIKKIKSDDKDEQTERRDKKKRKKQKLENNCNEK